MFWKQFAFIKDWRQKDKQIIFVGNNKQMWSQSLKMNYSALLIGINKNISYVYKLQKIKIDVSIKFIY